MAATQDDRRERELIRLFNLEVPPDRGRADPDAQLRIDGQLFEFELKSTGKRAFSTVRDLNSAHFQKWATLHWIFGVYDDRDDTLLECFYASPRLMAPWIATQERYMGPDLLIATRLPGNVPDSLLDEIFEPGLERFTIEQAKGLHKNQWTALQYREAQDLPQGGYSRHRMREILGLRAAYLLERGSTLNNRKIPVSYFSEFERITSEHAGRLRALVR